MTNLRLAATGCVLAVMLIGCEQKPPPASSIDNPAAFVDPLRQAIEFKRPELPGYLSSVTGLDAPESWGRWSNALLAPSVTVTFRQPLPKKFTVILEAQAVGENCTLPSTIRVGSQERAFIIGTGDSTSKFQFDLTEPVSVIEIIPPAPVVPKENQWSEDTRKIGIGLITLRVKTL